MLLVPSYSPLPWNLSIASQMRVWQTPTYHLQGLEISFPIFYPVLQGNSVGLVKETLQAGNLRGVFWYYWRVMKDSNTICALFCCHESDELVLFLCVYQVRAILDVFHREKRRNSEKGGKSGKGRPGLSKQPVPLELQLIQEMVMQELRQRKQRAMVSE